jgi:uncharacterized protein (DUF2141 family)
MLKNLIIIPLFLFILSTTAFSQYNLTIEISGLENSNGQIQLVLMDENENVIREYSEAIVENKCSINIKDIEQGIYAFKYFHDENINKELDTSRIGIPKEGYGFSNNAKGIFGPPSFKDTVFDVTRDLKVKCKPIYLMK